MTEQDKDDRAAPDGVERRKGERRKGGDRREMVRWEPDKEERRSGKDRRKNADDPWQWRDL